MPAFITGTDTISPPFADMVNAPHEAWVWEPGAGPEVEIRWAFSPAFDRVYSSDRLKSQVRFAIQTWEEAATIPYGAQSYYRRDNVGWLEFGDLRSIMLHELGHVLGFHHVEAQLEGRFYSWDPVPGFLEGSANTSMVMAASGVHSGSYNHVLSHDELLGMGLLYTSGITTDAPRTLRFQEVPFGDLANLVVTVDRLGGRTGRFAWARAAGFVRPRLESGRRTNRITGGLVRVNEEPSKPIGMRTRFDSWSYTPTTPGTRVIRIDIRTRGTNNPEPIAVRAGPFAWVTTVRYGPDFKDDLLHTWALPSGDTSRDVDFGLELDVYDWIVVEGHAVIVDADGEESRVPLPLVTFIEFGMIDRDWVPEPAPPGFALDPNPPVIARGIKIVGSAVVDQTVMAAVTDSNLLLGDLTKEAREQLGKKAEQLPGLPLPLELKSVDEEPSVVLLETSKGAEKELKNAVVLERPELLKEELLITARFGDERFEAEIATVLGRAAPLPVYLELDDRNPDTGTLRLSVYGGAGFEVTAVDPNTVNVSEATVCKVDVQGERCGSGRLVIDVEVAGEQKVLRLIGRTKNGATFEGTLSM